MAIVTVGVDFAKNVFALHGVNETAQIELRRLSVTGAKLSQVQPRPSAVVQRRVIDCRVPTHICPSNDGSRNGRFQGATVSRQRQPRRIANRGRPKPLIVSFEIAIRLAGFEVGHVIHRHGMDEDMAFEVEAALIDAYPVLTNISGGLGNAATGVMHAREILTRYNARIAVFRHRPLQINGKR